MKYQYHICLNCDSCVLLEKVPEAWLLSSINGPENYHERETGVWPGKVFHGLFSSGLEGNATNATMVFVGNIIRKIVIAIQGRSVYLGN